MRNPPFLASAHQFADLCRATIQSVLKCGFKKELKLDKSIVTNADREAESRFRELVLAQYPSHGILGEEYGEHQPNAEFQWIIDPVDGTEDLARGIPNYGTVIGLFQGGVPVVGILYFPALDRRYHASRGGGAYCASGALDASVESNMRIWDLAAAQILVEEAGGSFSYFRRFPHKDGREVLSAVMGKPSLVKHIERLLAEGRAI